jgi:hypothetical protein
MIISYSENFCFIRIPKSASTTAEVGLYDMGFVDESYGDICSGIEGSPDTDPEDVMSDRKSINYPSAFSEVQLALLDTNMVSDIEYINNIQRHRQHVWHTPYHMLLSTGLIDDDIECIGTIRNPVDRFVSITYYLSEFGDSEKIMSNPNETWDKFKNNINTFLTWDDMFRKPQHYFVKENATLWNVDNLYDWLQKFVKERGKEYIKPYHHKNNKKSQKIQLTKDRQQEILDMYEKDFLLWEQSYREFN